MHGFAIVEKLKELAEKLAGEKKAGTVTRINLQVADWSHLSEEELNFILKEIGKGTIVAKTRIVVKKTPNLASEYIVESIELEV